MLSLTTLFEIDFTLPANLTGESVTGILLIFFGLLLSLELLFPKEKLPAKQLGQSYKANISLFIFNSVAMTVLSVSSLYEVAVRYSGQGLLRYMEYPVVEAVGAFLLLDLLLYGWHKICHQFDCFWMFHKVHHNDTYLNVSTAFRIHFLELFLTNLLKAAYIVAMGMDEKMVLINEAVITFFVMFHHTNISFKGEKLVGRLFVMPYLHSVHHSVRRNEHDSNYGAVLSLWDYLFGTLKEIKPAAIGIRGRSPQDFTSLVKFGFIKEMPPVIQPVSLDAMIAEAAYYKAEKRNFNPGHEIRDWLEARRDIVKLIYDAQPEYRHSICQSN